MLVLKRDCRDKQQLTMPDKRAESMMLSAFFVGFSHQLQIQQLFYKYNTGPVWPKKILTIVPINSKIVIVEIENDLFGSF